jgi:uncharacterized protein
MTAPRCATCNRPVLPLAENPCFPFCSERCRAVDLGKWLGEEFRVVDRNPDAEDDGVPGTPGDGSHDDLQ